MDRRNWHLTAAGGDEGVTFQAKTRLPPQRIDPVRDRLLELNRHGCLRMHGDQVIVADVVVNDVEDALVLTATCGAAGGEVSEQEALRVANLLIEAMRVSHGFLA